MPEVIFSVDLLFMKMFFHVDLQKEYSFPNDPFQLIKVVWDSLRITSLKKLKGILFAYVIRKFKNLKMMKANKKGTSDSNNKPNDPGKVDPTKQDERDNDATRIRPEKEQKKTPETPETPETQPGGTKLPGNKGKGEYDPQEEPPYKRERHKPEPIEEPSKQQGSEINKGYNPAVPGNNKNEPQERDDQGNAVVKGFGKGL